MKRTSGKQFVPYHWTNRLFGGVVPWLYVNDTSFLKETRSTGGNWFWDSFYAKDPTRGMRPGGHQWLEPNAEGPKVAESFKFLRTLAAEGLHEAGMGENDFDVLFFPKWRTQRHQFGAAGYAIMKTSTRKDEAWEWIKFRASKDAMELAMPNPNTGPIPAVHDKAHRAPGNTRPVGDILGSGLACHAAS